jgi:hypothetical protein
MVGLMFMLGRLALWLLSLSGVGYLHKGSNLLTGLGVVHTRPLHGHDQMSSEDVCMFGRVILSLVVLSNLWPSCSEQSTSQI